MILGDDTIARLLEEPKPRVNLASLVPQKRKRVHLEHQLAIRGQDGSSFRLILRQNALDVLDFSVILGYELPQSNRLFRLRRHNGLDHEHTNKLEGERFFDYHAHVATERYQLADLDEEAFAEPTDAYVDLNGAVRHMLDIARFEPPTQTQMPV